MRSAILGAGVLVGLATAPMAGAAGLEGLHKHVQVGNKICMVDHFHYGQTSGWPTRPQAEASAAKSWAGFTGLEYGDEWADFRIATQSSMDCQQSASDRGGVVWSCKAKAVPCKPLSHPAAVTVPVYRPHPVPRLAAPRHHPVTPLPRHHRVVGPTQARPLVWPGDAR